MRLRIHRRGRGTGPSAPTRIVVAFLVGFVAFGASVGAAGPTDTQPLEPPADTLNAPNPTSAPADEPVATTPPTSAPTSEGEGSDATIVSRPGAAPSVRGSDIPLGSIAIAIAVFAAVGVTSIVLVRRHPRSAHVRTPMQPGEPMRAATRPDGESDIARLSPDEIETLDFLLELGEALLDAGDSVGHVESTLRNVARVNGIAGLGVLALPSSIVLSVSSGGSVATEVRTTSAGALRLDQIDDVLHVVSDAERASITAGEGSRQLARIRAAEPAVAPGLLLAAYVVSTIGLAMVLRGGWLEVVLAAVLGVVIGSLRLATASQGPAYQAFWPLIAASVVSASVFAAARLLDDLTVFPALVSPLITFLPGGLLTIAILELSTGQTVAGASRLASGAMQLVLLALGIVAGAQLVGVPGGDIRSGGEGVVAALVPWVGVGIFGVGVAWFNGARREAHRWILLVLYVAYAGQVIGGLLFGTTLSAFFGAVAMTPTAVLASRQRTGPTPLVTFLPGFWILVPGALGLEGVTRIIGEGADNGSGALITTLTSMIGISFGLLLGLILAGADPERPWSVTRSSR